MQPLSFKKEFCLFFFSLLLLLSGCSQSRAEINEDRFFQLFKPWDLQEMVIDSADGANLRFVRHQCVWTLGEEHHAVDEAKVSRLADALLALQRGEVLSGDAAPQQPFNVSSEKFDLKISLQGTGQQRSILFISFNGQQPAARLDSEQKIYAVKDVPREMLLTPASAWRSTEPTVTLFPQESGHTDAHN